MEEEMQRERREMEAKKHLLHLQEEKRREKLEMEKEMEALKAQLRRMERRQTAMERVVEGMEALRTQLRRMERRQTAMERVVEGMEVWMGTRETSLLQMVAEVTDKLEERMAKMEVLPPSSRRPDSQVQMELEAHVQAKVAGMQQMLEKKMLEIADYVDKVVKERTNHCLTLSRYSDQSDTGLEEDPMVTTHSTSKGTSVTHITSKGTSGRGHKGGRRPGRRKEELILTSSGSGSGYWSSSGSHSGRSGSGTSTSSSDGISSIGSSSSGGMRRRRIEVERKSFRRRAEEADRNTGSTVLSESHTCRATSATDPRKTGSDLSEEAGQGDRGHNRGFFRKLFGKKKGKKS